MITAQQMEELRGKLTTQKEKLESVLASLQIGSPAADVNRVNDNADAGNEAMDNNQLVEYESLQRETQILLDRTNQALDRMANGTYGKTDEGEDIPYERLLIDPTVTTTM